MSTRLSCVVAMIACSVALSPAAFAQMPPTATADDGWRVTVYPVLAWIPTHIGIDVNVPTDGGGDGGGGTGSEGGSIVDSRWDGAFLAGFSVSKGGWGIDADGLWAGVGGDRPERPQMTVDVDLIYGHVSGRRRLYKALYVTGGVRRMAVKYQIQVAGLDEFTRKPGVWDPLVGVGLHHVGRTFELHGVLEGGGFGVGADTDVGGTLRGDWKPFRYVGFTAGYSFLYFKLNDKVAGRTFVAKQTLHGPLVGVGLYF